MGVPVLLFTDARTDAKVRALADDEYRVWVQLLLFAADHPNIAARGSFQWTGFLADEVAGGDEALLRRAVQRFLDFDFLIHDGEISYHFRRFHDRQEDGYEALTRERAADSEITQADRMRRFRQQIKATGAEHGPNWHTRQRPLVLQRDGDRCVFCGTDGPLLVTFLLPPADGGPQHLDNLGASCRPCIGRKAGRAPEVAGMGWYNLAAQARYDRVLAATFERPHGGRAPEYSGVIPPDHTGITPDHTARAGEGVGGGRGGSGEGVPLPAFGRRHVNVDDQENLTTTVRASAREGSHPAGGGSHPDGVIGGDHTNRPNGTAAYRDGAAAPGAEDGAKAPPFTPSGTAGGGAARGATPPRKGGSTVTPDRTPLEARIVALLQTRRGMPPDQGAKTTQAVRAALVAYPRVDALRVTNAYVAAQLTAAPSLGRWRRWMENESERIAANTDTGTALPDDDAAPYRVGALDFSQED